MAILQFLLYEPVFSHTVVLDDVFQMFFSTASSAAVENKTVYHFTAFLSWKT